jgi:hypothetical protein
MEKVKQTTLDATPESVWAALMETREQMYAQWEKDRVRQEQRDEKERAEREKREQREKRERQREKQREQREKQREQREKKAREKREEKERAERAKREAREQLEKKERAEREEKERAEREKERAERAERDEKERVERAKTEEYIKSLNHQMGIMHNTIDRVVELLMTPNLTLKFRDLGYTFTTYARDKVYKDANNNALAEVDVFVENGDYALVVEAKTTPDKSDIKDHEHRMAVLRRYADERGDKRKYIGAIAAPGFKSTVRNAAFRAGFFVVETSENAVNIVSPEGFKPKEW